MTVAATEVEFDPKDALARGITEIKDKAPEVETNRNYYDGEHPRIEWITKIRKVFGPNVADQVHVTNYCEKVIDMPLARMAVTGFTDPTAEALFAGNGLYQAQEDLYFDAMLAAEGYIILAEAEPGSEVPYEIVVQRSEDCHVEPGSLKPNDRAWAVKVWADYDYGEEGAYRAQVWDGTTYWRYVAEVNPDQSEIPGADAFTADPEDDTGPHGFDRVPVIPFRRRRQAKSRLSPIRPIQDRIDMLEIEKVIAGLFGASRQRVFFTHQELDDGDVESSPDFAIVLEPGDETTGGKASVTEFDYTPLENYDQGIDAEIDRLYELADLPKHARSNPGTDPSGEAIKADEGPFTEMIGGYTRSFETSWVEAFAMLGIDTEVTWRDPVTRNEQAQAVTVKTLVDAGAPLEWALAKYADVPEDDLADLRKALEAKQASEAAAREAAIQSLDQGRDPAEVVESRFE